MRLDAVKIPLNYNDAYWENTAWDNLRAHILLALGYPTLRIELTKQHLNLAIHDAISKLYKWGYGQIEIQFDISSVDANGFADIPAAVAGTQMIKDVIFVSTSLSTTTATELLGEAAVWGFQGGATAFFSLKDVTFDLAGYALWRKNLENANDLLGLTKSWQIMAVNGVDRIKVYPNKMFKTTPAEIGVLHGRLFTPEELSSDDWVRNYAVAKAMHTLGIVRGKFSGFSAPGGQGSTDGEALKTEATATMEKLIEEIKSLRPSPAMFQF